MDQIQQITQKYKALGNSVMSKENIQEDLNSILTISEKELQKKMLKMISNFNNNEQRLNKIL